MSYGIAVPVSIANPRFEQYYPDFLRYLKAAGATRVFLCPCTALAPEEEKQRCIALLKKYVPLLQAEGFEVGSWNNSLGHGGTCGAEQAAQGVTLMRSLDGVDDGANYCPLDEHFQELFCDWIKRLASTGVSIIQLDDDYRMSFRLGERFCCCDRHVALIEAETGEKFDAARMKKALLEGAPNKWRDAWLHAQGYGLTLLAGKLREALDTVAPEVRLTACSVLSTWDVDGVDSLTLSRTFAGGTRPLLRLIGAPYWASMRNYDEAGLAVVCEYERMQAGWARGSGVELYAEGDPCPRVRYTVPGVYLDRYDQVLRAAGEIDGIQKYFFNYSSSPSYDTYNFDLHMRHQDLFRRIHEAFDGKEAAGIYTYEPMQTYALATDPGVPESRCIPASLRFATDNSLPIRHTPGTDAAIIFGDAAECADAEQFAHGAILDAAAAQILTRRGFDVGLESVGEVLHPGAEGFPHESHAPLSGGKFLQLNHKTGAEVLSVLRGGNAEGAPCCFRYENADGQRFLIYAFVARDSLQTLDGSGVMRGLGRTAQVRSQLAWLSGREPDAICDGAPDLYMLVKKDADSMTVGLWNFGVDTVFEPVVHLGADWADLTVGEGSAVLDGRTVTLEPLPAFGCAFFTLHNEP